MDSINNNIPFKLRDDEYIRKSLVDTAVEFLTSPKVSSYSKESKTKFLEKKGLSPEEIKNALEISAEKHNVSGVHMTNNYEIVSRQPLSPPALQQKSSTWSIIRNMANISIFISGLAFGVHYLYKFYIGPFLTGRKPKSPKDDIIEIQQTVMDILHQINCTLEKMDLNIAKNNILLEELKSSANIVNSSGVELESIQNEISTLKGLLINRKSFPAPPTISSSIPNWQRITATNKEKERSPEMETGTKSDEEITPEQTNGHLDEEVE